MKIKIIIFAFILTYANYAQNDTSDIQNNYKLGMIDREFKPLEANTFEPRVGAFVQTNSKKLRLDIGSNINIYNFESQSKKSYIYHSINSEFMTWTRLRSQSNFKFPVESSDYYFGLNYTFIAEVNENQSFDGRFRFAHISSHIVDGYLKDTNTLSVNPFVYSREFIDITLAYSFKQNYNYFYRIYGGFNTVFSRRPKDANIIIPNIGFDGFKEIIVIPYSNYQKKVNIDFVFGYDFKLIGFNDIYTGVNSFQTGLKFNFPGTAYTKGIGINYYLYDGKSIHGMFYNQRDSYSGIGFQIYY